MVALIHGAGARLRTRLQALQRRLPSGAVRLGRATIHYWGLATAHWRMTPSFIVAGAQRSGTTTLYRLLEAHPSLVRPTISKGIGYFDDNYARGPRWYRAHFPLRVPRRRSAAHYTFEMSGYYLLHPLAPFRIARDLPGVKVIVMVRDPVERAYSAHRHEHERGFDSLTFEEAIRAEPARTAGDGARLTADPTAISYNHRHYSYLARSRYAEQLAAFIDALGPKRVYIIEADRFFHDPIAEFHALQAWLDLPIWTPPKVERWNERPREPMPAQLRAELEQYFEPFDRDLAAIIGHTPAWREQWDMASSGPER